MVKAVFFDVGSTLIDPSPDIGGVFFEKACARGHAIKFEKIIQHMPAVCNFYEKEYLRDGDFWCSPERSVGMYLEMYRYLAYLVGLSHDAEGIAQDVHTSYLSPQYWEIIDDVIPCLEELKHQGFQLAVVSNWASNLENLLQGLSLMSYFDEVIASADVRYRKPDPMIFKLLLKRLHLEPGEVVHVGDRIDADGVGARCAKIEPIIIDRTTRLHDNSYRHITSLEELPALLNNV